jgi:hypothetical protein
VSAAQSGFNNQIIHELAARLPEIDPGVILGTGATQIREAFTAEQIPIVLDAYVSGLKAVFAITVAAYGVSAIVGLFGSWKKIQYEPAKAGGGAA